MADSWGGIMVATRTVETVEELKGLVGQELGVGQWVEISQEQVNNFADITGDHQWIHVDPARAAKTQFRGTIAHGFLTLSLLPLLARDREGIKVDLHSKMGLNYGLNRVRFVSPVRVGENVYQMTYQQTVEIEGEERPAMVAETIGRAYL